MAVRIMLLIVGIASSIFGGYILLGKVYAILALVKESLGEDIFKQEEKNVKFATKLWMFFTIVGAIILVLI